MTGNFYRYPSIVIAILAFFTAGVGGICAAQGKEHFEPGFHWRTAGETDRSELIGGKIMEILAIKQVMIIVDLRDGDMGQFAYAFSESLKGTGRVFTADANPDYVDYVKKEAEKRRLANLYPVLVKKGLDEFYGKQKYDLITPFRSF